MRDIFLIPQDDDRRRKSSLCAFVPNCLQSQSIGIRLVRTRPLSSEARLRAGTMSDIACGSAMIASSALARPSTACMSLDNSRKCRTRCPHRILRTDLGLPDVAKAAEGSNEGWGKDFLVYSTLAYKDTRQHLCPTIRGTDRTYFSASNG